MFNIFMDPFEIHTNLSQFWSNCQILEFSIFFSFQFLVKLTKYLLELKAG